MGIGWAQIHNNSVTHNFSAQITNWPSSYKAELFAILSAISTLPRNSTVDIYTDSQSIISKFTNLFKAPTSLPNTLNLILGLFGIRFLILSKPTILI